MKRILLKPAAVLAAPLVAAVLLMAPSAVQAKGQPSFFNTKEVRSSDLKAFTKWTGALERFTKARKSKAALKCHPGPGEMRICGNAEWIDFLKQVKGKSRLDQVRLVNARINKAKYVLDKNNWGKNDYWAIPQEFMSRFGDCEDYAIMKYLSLRMLGWKDSDLRIVAVKDLNLKVGHAVLVVYMTNKAGKRIPLVLDNQIKKVVKASSIRHYQPVFSINQKNWWRHLS